MIDSTAFKELMNQNIMKVPLVGAKMVIGNLLFRKSGKKMKDRKYHLTREFVSGF